MKINATAQQKVRLDRWLWAARFFKTRALAKTAVEGGHVQVDGRRSKPSKEISIGANLQVQRAEERFDITVTGLAERRGSATIAATLYAETSASQEQRAAVAAQRKMQRAGLRVPAHRPDKHARRALRDLKQFDEPAADNT